MKKVLIAYFSLTGKTEKMAEYIAEGVRFSGQQAVAKKISGIKTANDLSGYDGYIFGSPTYHRDMAEPMKTFLSWQRRPTLRGNWPVPLGPIPTVVMPQPLYSIPCNTFTKWCHLSWVPLT